MTTTKSFMSTKRFSKFVTWDDKAIGTTIGGLIISDPTMQQQTDVNDNSLRYFPADDNGNREPMMQMCIEIQTPPNPALDSDDGKRTLTIRGGFKYESSRKALSDELARNDLEDVRVGDHIALTRIANLKAAGTKARTHQFTCEYTKAEDLDEAQTAVVEVVAEAPKKRGRPAKAAAAPVNSTWEE